MNENEMVTAGGGKPVYTTIKNVLRVLMVLCIIFVFCPSFLVSCSGEDLKVSVMTAVGGIKSGGQTIVDPHPVMLICLLIPIAALVLLIIKKFQDKMTAIIVLAGSGVDLIVWFIFRSTAKKTAEEAYCTFKTTPWFVINIIVLILSILLTGLAVLGVAQLETDLLALLTGSGAKNVLNQVSGAVTQAAGTVAENISNLSKGSQSKKGIAVGYCAKCGGPIGLDSKFCISCGTPVPESMLAEAEAKKKEIEEAKRQEEERLAAEAAKRQEAAAAAAAQSQGKSKFCQQCGAELGAGVAFCQSCGAKVQ